MREKHEFQPSPHIPVSCRICGEERRFHQQSIASTTVRDLARQTVERARRWHFNALAEDGDYESLEVIVESFAEQVAALQREADAQIVEHLQVHTVDVTMLSLESFGQPGIERVYRVTDVLAALRAGEPQQTKEEKGRLERRPKK